MTDLSNRDTFSAKLLKRDLAATTPNPSSTTGKEGERRIIVALFELLVWPREVEPWFHSWYRGRVETLDAKYNLIVALFEPLVWPHEVEPWFYPGRVKSLDAVFGRLCDVLSMAQQQLPAVK